MYRSFVNAMLNNRPFLPMFEAEGGQAGGGTGTAEPGAGGEGSKDGEGGQGGNGEGSGGQGGSGTNNDGGEGSKKDTVTFSDEQQAFINNLINKTIKEERTKADQKRQQELDRQKMTDDQKREADLKEAQTKLEQFKARSLNYEIKDVARELGVPANKVERFLKLVDREDVDVDDEGNVDRSKVTEVVKAVLGDFPEFKAGSEGGKGPGGDFDKGSNTGAKYSLAQIKDMSPKEIKDNWEEVQKSMNIHNKK